MARNDHIDPAIEEEYRSAREAYRAAKERYRAAAVVRESAHRLAELRRSQMAQKLAGMSEAEWAELAQALGRPVAIPDLAEVAAGGAVTRRA